LSGLSQKLVEFWACAETERQRRLVRELIHAFRLEELLRHTECKTVQLFWRTKIYRKSVVFCFPTGDRAFDQSLLVHSVVDSTLPSLAVRY
jgi:hypothetical protein